MTLTTPVATNVVIGLAVTFFVLLMLLLSNLIRRRPTGFVATCCVALGMFLAFQFVLVLAGYR